SGLTGPPDAERLTHLAEFTSPQRVFEMGDDEELRVPLQWTDGRGVTVTKTFVFKRGSYEVALEYTVHNASDAPWPAAPYAQILRNDPPVERKWITTNVENYSFRGPAISDGGKYRKLDIPDDDDRHLALEVQNGWIAALQHHFVSAVVPPENEPYRLALNAQDREYVLSAAGALKTVAPGETGQFRQTLFIGPKLQDQLEAAGPKLELVADYGKL